MSKHHPKISIIIPNLHSPAIGHVLESLRSQEFDLSQVEILVVGLDRYHLVKKDDLVQFLPTENPVPPSQARNLGAAAAKGETLIFLDADCVPQPGWLAAMLEAYTHWPDAGAISGAMLPDGDTFAAHCGQIAGFHEHLSLNKSGRRRLLASFSLLVSRSTWQAVGGFASEAVIAEDVDFSTRLSQRRLSLYLEPRARVFHKHPRGDLRSLWQHALVGGKHSIQIRLKHREWFKMSAWAVHPWAWRLLSPGIAVVRTVQIYATVPGLWRYWYCAPWVVLSKLAWCWGAATGLAQSSGQTCGKQRNAA